MEIENVTAGTFRYIMERWGFWYIGPGVLLVLTAWLSLYLLQYSTALTKFFLVLPFIWFFVGWMLAYSAAMQRFMKEFARENNFDYYDSGSLEDVRGTLFERGHSKDISHVVAGKQGDFPVRFFHYQFSVQRGKEPSTYYFTVAEITLRGPVPHVLMESRGMFDFMSFRGKAHPAEVSLGETFRRHFHVYTAKDFEIEAFEIFTPEVMEVLIEKAKGFDLEFVENRIYVFTRGIITRRSDMAKLLGLTKYLVVVLAPRLTRLHDDVAAHHAVRQKRN
mgnify:CR=1 FL=1